MKQIYLDNQSTTPIDPQVFSEMEPWFKEKFGNASSRNHMFGWEANDAVEIARQDVADLISASPSEIIFTSGATESNNIAIQGIAKYQSNKEKHLITVSTEHKAVLDVYEYLQSIGFKITVLSVNSDGFLDLKSLEDSIQDDTVLISVMHVNNEIGIIQPIEEIGRICKDRKIIFHVDAAQSVGKISIDVDRMGIDLLSISSHKIYGPKGVGALYIRKRKLQVNLAPIIFGGGHERKYRSGTLNVPSIVGLGKAAQICGENILEESNNIKKLRDLMFDKIISNNQNIFLNGSIENRIAGNLNIRIPGISNESLISNLPEIAISTGSACTTSTIAPSYVLLSIGLSKEDANSSIRIGIGRFNTKSDIDFASEAILACIKKIKN